MGCIPPEQDAAFVAAMEHVLTVYQRITLVCDNLNTHCPGSFYAAFPPEEVFRILSKIELVFTPKHGSWLFMAEPELS